jgi:endonuclease/exonuclease/phosphatase family metal-dependent hydrolase
MKLISWNLLHRDGAELADIARLIERHQPDLLLMQEATRAIEGLTDMVGGACTRSPLPGRVHGLAIWTPAPPPRPILALPLPSGPVVQRVWQMADLGDFAIANVHLSQGQLLNRMQLRHIARLLPHRAAVVGDYNVVGPTLLPGFHDGGPRRHTHRMSDVLPLRLDRCLVRGLVCTEADVLARGASDHRPIMLRLGLPASLEHSKIGQQQAGACVA